MIEKISIAFSVLLLTAFSSWSQVELGGEEEPAKEDKKKEFKEKPSKDGSTEIYMVTNWSNTSSKLEMNAPPFGDPLGEREFEKSLNTWSFGVGFRNRLSRNLSIQGGIAFMRNGESFLFEESDTLFKYATTYSYVAMPIKALYTYGEDIKFLAGGGITPQLFTSYVQEQEWRDPNNAEGDETIKSQNGYSSFVLSAAINVGVQLRFSDNWTLLFMPEYRIQLTDSYEKTDSYNHFARALGFDIGLTFKL
ncbi:MAG: outer membrane beta-barrel protein [Crocinitomicaceae bacterium]